MTVRNNEGKVCDAVVRAVEKWTDVARTDVRHPEEDGVGPAVDFRLKLGVREYAVEHTRIESYENQIGTAVVANRIGRHIREYIPDPLPNPSYYELQFPIAVSLPSGKARRERAFDNLVDLIRATARILRDRNADRILSVRNPYMANDFIQGTPPGFDCAFEAPLAVCNAHQKTTGRGLVQVYSP